MHVLYCLQHLCNCLQCFVNYYFNYNIDLSYEVAPEPSLQLRMVWNCLLLKISSSAVDSKVFQGFTHITLF